MRSSVWFLAATAFAAAGFVLAQDRADAPRVCRHREADGGGGTPVDLAKVRREHDRVARALAGAVEVSFDEPRRLLLEEVDAGLPACRASARRERPLAETLPAELAGRSLLLASADDLRRLAPRHPDAILFATRARTVSALADVAKDLRRPVEVATKELAEALGVACTPTIAIISEEGDRLERVEGE